MKKIAEKAPVKGKKKKEYIQRLVKNDPEWIKEREADGWAIAPDADKSGDRVLMQKEKSND